MRAENAVANFSLLAVARAVAARWCDKYRSLELAHINYEPARWSLVVLAYPSSVCTDVQSRQGIRCS